MATCNHKYTHTTVRIAVRDDGAGPHQILDIVVHCLLCAQTAGSNMSSKLTDWQSLARQGLPELDRVLSDFGVPGTAALDA